MDWLSPIIIHSVYKQAHLPFIGVDLNTGKHYGREGCPHCGTLLCYLIDERHFNVLFCFLFKTLPALSASDQGVMWHFLHRCIILALYCMCCGFHCSYGNAKQSILLCMIVHRRFGRWWQAAINWEETELQENCFAQLRFLSFLTSHLPFLSWGTYFILYFIS